MTDKTTNEENNTPQKKDGVARGFKRALSMVALVGAVAFALSYWNRTGEVTVTLIVEIAHGGAKIKNATVLLVDTEGSDRVRVSFSQINDVQEPQRRKVKVKKGTYFLKTLVTHTDGSRKRTEKKIKVEDDLSLRVKLR